MRFYERQFITREAVNKDVITKFEELIDKYFESNNAERNGLPSVKYFAEQCFLSPNYFGDLVKKETGRNPQEYIQSKIIELAKDKLLGSEKSVSEISYELGFQYSQHFNRYFKRYVGKTPSEYRTTAV
jgi:AraC-like DNA-binding protein